MINMAGDPVVFCYRGSWCAQGTPTSWNSSWRVIGTKGTLLWNGEDDIQAQAVHTSIQSAYMHPTLDLAVPTKHLEHTLHAGLIHEFIECVQNDTLPQTHCQDNIKSLAMVLGAIKSAINGERIDIDIDGF